MPLNESDRHATDGMSSAPPPPRQWPLPPPAFEPPSNGAAKTFRVITRLAALLFAAGGIFYISRAYQGYRLAYFGDGNMDDAVAQIRSIQFQLNTLSIDIKRAQNVRETARSPRDQLQRLYPIEERYLQQAQGIAEHIQRMDSTGTLRFLFEPGDETPRRLKEFRDWLALEVKEDHPLLATDKRVDRKLTVVASHVDMFMQCLRVGERSQKYLRSDIDGCMKTAAKQVDPLP